MKIIGTAGNKDIAKVYIAEFGPGEWVEFVEALAPPKPRSEKWVLLVSTLFGCPVECAMCDAGGFYHGKVSREGILAQIDHMVRCQYRLTIVLDNDHGVTHVTEPPERVKEAPVVPHVKSYAGFVQDVEHPHKAGAYLGREPYTLELAPGQRTGGAIESEVGKPDIGQEAQAIPDLLDYG